MKQNARRIDYGFDSGLTLTLRGRFHAPDRLSEKAVARRFCRALTDQPANLGDY
jgi:hypothetical protein